MTVRDLINELRNKNPNDPILVDYLLPEHFLLSEEYPISTETKQRVFNEVFEESQPLVKEGYITFNELAEVVQDGIYELQETLSEVD